MRYITFKLRYPKGYPIVYVRQDSVLAISENLTEKGMMGAIIYTANPVAIHVAEDAETVWRMISK